MLPGRVLRGLEQCPARSRRRRRHTFVACRYDSIAIARAWLRNCNPHRLLAADAVVVPVEVAAVAGIASVDGGGTCIAGFGAILPRPTSA